MQRNPSAETDDQVHSSQGAPEARESAVRGRTRRGVLLGAGLVGAAGVVAACGGSGQGSAAQSNGNPPAAPGAGGALAKTSDIPVGGGKVFPDQQVVVTQPVQGTFKAFSSTCTHRGCGVDSVSGGTINCPCHGSKFKISDASVASGPADKPLPAKQITVAGGEIKLV
jgi:Rieske Fe-S protein